MIAQQASSHCRAAGLLACLQSTRLAFVRADANALPYLHRLWADTDVRRNLLDGQSVSLEQAQDMIEAFADQAPARAGLWLLTSKQDAQPLGCIGLVEISAGRGEPRVDGLLEPLVALDPAHRGRGYAIEALMTLVRHAFETLDLKALAGVHDVPNSASGRLLERAGFLPLSEVDGPRHAMRIYILTHRMWAASRLGFP